MRSSTGSAAVCRHVSAVAAEIFAASGREPRRTNGVESTRHTPTRPLQREGKIMANSKTYNLTADQEILMLLALSTSEEAKKAILSTCSIRIKAGDASQLNLALADILNPVDSVPDPTPTVNVVDD